MAVFRVAAPLVGAIATLLCLTSVSLADCGSYAEHVDAALARRDRSALKLAYANVSDCTDANYRSKVGHHIAQRLLIEAGESPSELALLELVKYGAEWQALAMLGDIAQKQGDYPAASTRYQQALLQIADEFATPTKPGPAVIMAIKRKAEEASLLSPTYVATPRGRGNENEGLAAASIRGVKIERVSLPVQFVFARTELTSEGYKAAEDLASLLKNESPSPAGITLVGHTDRVGTDQANMVLSLARATAVAEFLRQRGITIRIAVRGVGFHEPYDAADRTELSQEQIDQLDRRVELVRD